MSEVEEKPFTSSLKICVQKPVFRKGWGGRSNASPPHPYFAADPRIFHLKTTLPLISSTLFPSFWELKAPTAEDVMTFRNTGKRESQDLKQ
jgi:hypothetical protein